MARIAVAGGAGLIGSHLCSLLVERGDTVYCIDNLSTGFRENILPLSKKKNFHFVKADISKPFRAPKVGCIYNLASPASPIDYQEKPIQTLDAGSVGVKNLLELARKSDAKILFASTSEVYGNPLEHPQKESYWGNVNPIGPRSCYDEAKRFGEAMCSSYRRVYGVDAKIARIFNTYGPKMRANDGRVVPNFICQALGNEPITVYGNGSQTRSFCYVSDLVDGLDRLMASEEQGPMNLGNPRETTMLELANLVVSLAGSGSKIVFEGLPQDDPERRMPDISLAKKTLGWHPKTSLEEGLAISIDYFRSRMHAGLKQN
ncbi:GDP-L-fucose synthase [uncultured archaeon]|nr:GDP-L-fucose synthase [uncultured archaeon]